MATDEKSHEIRAIPEPIKFVDIRGAMITIDAMGTQKSIAKKIIDGGADYVLALKGNHWSIENTCHGSLDFTYREDESRIRNQHLRENFA